LKNYNWGILAPGKIAHEFTKGLQSIPAANLYAVGSRDVSRAQSFADTYGYKKAYGNYDALAEDENVDIIYVATPHPQHEEAVITCLKNGKAVLCEKPFAVNEKQAVRMINCAKTNQVFLMEAMWTRFLPSICKVRELLLDGAIGNVRHVHVDFGFRCHVSPERRIFAPVYAGGSLLDLGVYGVSFFNMVYSKRPNSIQSKMTIGETGVDETTVALFNYGDGKSAFLLSSIRTNTVKESQILGDEGFIKIPNFWCSDTIVLSNKNGISTLKIPFEQNGYQYQSLEVMFCLENGLLESSVMPLDETREITKILDSIRFANGYLYPFE
jgi:predicted dehydrogenase